MKRIINLLLVVLSLSSCLKDRTQTEFSEIELPVLDNPEKRPELLVERKNYRLPEGTVLKITPAISYSDMDDLSYEWFINGESVSTEKNLEWTIDCEGKVPAALYVTRISAGNAVIFPFSVELAQPFERGWIVVSDKGGAVTYDFIEEYVNPELKKLDYKNHENIIQGSAVADDWLETREFWSQDKQASSKVLNLSRNLDECFYIDEAMLRTFNLREEFQDNLFPDGVNYFKEAMYSGYVTYLLGDDGHLYSRLGGKDFYSGKYSPYPEKFNGEVIKPTYLITPPYKTGICLLYEQEKGRFLTIANGYGQDSNKKAGVISEIPEETSNPNNLNTFKGGELVWAKVINPDFYYETKYPLLLIRKSQEGQYTLSEYIIEMASNGVVASSAEVYSEAELPGFGPNSQVAVFEDVFQMVGKWLYYTDSSDPRILYVAKRQGHGINTPKIFHTFESSIVSIEIGVIQRQSQSMALGFKDGSVQILNLNSKEVYVPGDENKPDAGSSVSYEWKDLGGKILKIDFHYGKIGNWFK